MQIPKFEFGNTKFEFRVTRFEFVVRFEFVMGFEFRVRFEFNSNLLGKKFEFSNFKFLNEYNH